MADEGTANGPTGTAEMRAHGRPSPSGKAERGSGAEAPQAWSYAGATLKLTRHGGLEADDRYGAMGTLSPMTEGGALVVGGATVGTVVRNSGGRLMLRFAGAQATEDNVAAVLRQLTYVNPTLIPSAEAVIHWSLAEGGASGAPIAEGLTVVTVDGAPIWRSARRAARTSPAIIQRINEQYSI